MKPSRAALIVAMLLALVAVLLVPARAFAVVDGAAQELPQAFEGQLDLVQDGSFPQVPQAPRLRAGADEATLAQLRAYLNTALMNVETGDINVRGYNVTIAEFKQVLEEVINGNPDLFYVNSGYTFWRTQSGYVTRVRFKYGDLTPDQIAVQREEYQAALTDLLSWVPPEASDAEKVKAVHDWLCRNVLYGGSSDTRYSAYGALVEGRAVCQGYSAAMISALRVLEIDCVYAMQEDANHAWNIVKVDGLWYHVDVTWDDPLTGYPSSSASGDYEDEGFWGQPRTTYFLKSGSWMTANAGSDGTHAHWDVVGSAYGSVSGIETDDNTAYDNWSDFPTYSAPWSDETVEDFALSDEIVVLFVTSSADVDIVGVVPEGLSSLTATWSSSNPSVAVVDRLGHVTTGNSIGDAVITCTIGNVGHSCLVRVVNQMHRLYNQWTGEHFYTADEDEFEQLVTTGWTDEGIGWLAPGEGVPVLRLYNPWVPGGDHHYTTSEAEYEHLCEIGWQGEGVGWYSDAYEGVPLYRQYNPYAITGTHNYTTSIEENDHLVEVGWLAEGIGWYGV